jgi:hypothetical protein
MGPFGPRNLVESGTRRWDGCSSPAPPSRGPAWRSGCRREGEARPDRALVGGVGDPAILSPPPSPAHARTPGPPLRLGPHRRAGASRADRPMGRVLADDRARRDDRSGRSGSGPLRRAQDPAGVPGRGGPRSTSDVAGFFLLFPPSRHWFQRRLRARMERAIRDGRVQVGVWSVGGHPDPGGREDLDPRNEVGGGAGRPGSAQFAEEAVDPRRRDQLG